MDSPNESKRFYDEAWAAFLAADRMAKNRPQPGTPEWMDWQRSALQAIAANEQFLKLSSKDSTASE